MTTTMEETMFTHVHVHTSYSFLDGYNPIARLVGRAKELGMTALAITDHNHLGGCLEFQRECNQQGIKPLLGCEMYFTFDTDFASKPIEERNQNAIDKARAAGILPEEAPIEMNPKTGKPKKAVKLKKSDIKDIIAPFEYDMSQYHIILIAINQVGWKNLVKLQSEAADKCTYNGRFLCDDAMLAKYSEGLVMTSACFLPGTLVKTINGHKPIEDIIPGELVLTHKNQYAKVITPTSRRYLGRLCTVKAKHSSLNINCTEDHKFFVLTKNEYMEHKKLSLDNTYIPKGTNFHDSTARKYSANCKIFKGSWVEAKDLKKGDFLLSPIDAKIENLNKLDLRPYHIDRWKTKHLKSYSLPISPELLELVGIFAAEGSFLVNNNGINISLAANEIDLQKRTLFLINSIFGINGKVRTKSSDGVDVVFLSKELANVFRDWFGYGGCEYKEMPSFVRFLEPSLQLHFFKGAFLGDGSYRNKEIKYANSKTCCADELTYTTISERLTLDLLHILGRNHINPAITEKPSFTDKSGVYHKKQYYISITGLFARKLKDFVDNSTTFKLSENEYLSKNIPCNINGVYYLKSEVKTVSFQEVETTVYCLNVENDHSFVVKNVAVHNCIGNVAADMIIEGRTEEAEAQILRWKEIFGDRFFLEIQPLNIEKQWRTNMAYMELASRHDITVVATNDVHWTLKEDADDHDTLLCIGTGKLKADEERMRYSPDFWLKDRNEMVESFEIQLDSMIDDGIASHCVEEYANFCLQAIDNTSLIADAVEAVTLGSPVPLFPEVQTPIGLSTETYLTSRCYQELYKYLSANPHLDRFTYERRLHEELGVINMKGFAPYMLAVEEYITWANANGCPTGPGRGSAAGSLTLFLLGITRRIDPIQYQLLFSRFLTVDRTAPPDVDTDFDYDGRDSVVTHLEDKYGKEKVSHIGTYTVLGVKSGLKDVGRVLNIDFGDMNTISKKLDEIMDKPQPKFKDFDALKEGDITEKARWAAFNTLEKKYPELFRLARAFEGNPRNFGVHASGILVTPDAISDLFPTRKTKDGTTVTLYTGPQLEDLGAIKFDILGLKTITVIKNTLHYIDKDLTFDDLYEAVNVNDPDIFSMICDKKTDGLFQIESDMFKGIISDIKPDSLNDIVAITSLG